MKTVLASRNIVIPEGGENGLRWTLQWLHTLVPPR
jgi:hypothetical protein